MRARAAFGLLFVALTATRFCHLGILWPEETLPLAAAGQLLDGKMLYGEVWFDKPPLLAWTYLLWGAQTGWPLRLAGALYALLACWLAWRFARDLWGEREGLWAAALLGFFLIFGIAASVTPLAADLLMLAPHIAAVWLAWRGRAFWSGVACGVALLINVKAVFVVAACALFAWRSLPVLALGCVLPNAIALSWLAAHGALGDYWLQTWKWGMLYSGNPMSEHPLANGVVRTLNWAGFHAALIASALWWWLRDRKPDGAKFAAWAALSMIAVAGGWRFFPRYYFQLLPVLVLAGARGFVLLGRRRWVVLVLLLVPAIRFGPRYAMLAADLAAGRPEEWRDVAMDRDSREASRLVRSIAKPADTLFVWGFRPEIFAYTGMPAASRFLESQPLTGVLADRHLTKRSAMAGEWTRRNLEEALRSSPSIVVDGLGPLNPALRIEAWPGMADWMKNYAPAGSTAMTRIYRRIPPPGT